MDMVNMEEVAKVIHDAKRRHLRKSQPIPASNTPEQRRAILAKQVDDEIAHRTITELQGALAKLFPDQERFNRLCEYGRGHERIIRAAPCIQQQQHGPSCDDSHL
jgi:hypothetical protein